MKTSKETKFTKVSPANCEFKDCPTCEMPMVWNGKFENCIMCELKKTKDKKKVKND